MSKSCIILLSFLLLSHLTVAQSPQYAFRVYFNNKAGTTFSLDDPAAFLSQRAIDRRIKYNIQVDSSDFPVNEAYIDSVLEKTNSQLHTQSKWNNTAVVLLADSSLISSVQTLPFVDTFRLVAYYPAGLSSQNRVTPPAQKPTNFDEQFYASAWAQIHLCNGAYLHQQGKMGAGILIVMIDAGFEGVNTISAFDTLRSENRLIDRWNFVHDTLFRADEGGHGTKTFSCIAGYLPNVYVGTAPEATFALYTTEDLSSEQPIEEDNWAAAAERADSLGADLISSSLGYNTFDPPFSDYLYADLDGHSTYIARAANTASAKGILVVVSAGNEGITPWQHILSPGDADSVLTIGSVNMQKSPAASSGRGPNASGIIKPDVAGLGINTAVVAASGNIENNSGTSFATPVIAGLTACLMQAVPDSTPAAVRALIRSVSDHFTEPNNDLGYGVPDFRLAYNQATSIGLPPVGKTFSSIYPNPAGDYLTIRLPDIGPKLIQVIDHQGKLLLNAHPEAYKETIKLNISSIVPGIYFLKVTADRGAAVYPFIKK